MTAQETAERITHNGNIVYEKDHWQPSYTGDQLYLQMCENEIEDPHGNKINKYYVEAAKYVGRRSAGNFDGKNAKHKPVFHLDPNDFSPELRANLIERLKTSKESIHRVVEDAVFRIFLARHKMIFYQYIQAEGLRWRFV